MSIAVDQTRRSPGPLHAFLIAATVPPFLGAALTDYAYASSYQVQWTNFSSWLIVAGLVFGGAALVCALLGLRRAGHRSARYLAHSLLLLAAIVLGFINALVHAADAWASMPAGLVLSLVVAALACAATVVAFNAPRAAGGP